MREKATTMIDQIYKILKDNNIPEDIIDATMDALIIGLMNKLTPTDKRLLKKEMEKIREENFAIYH